MSLDSFDSLDASSVSAEMLRTETQAAFSRVWETSLGLPIEFVSFDIHTVVLPPFVPEWFGSVAWIGGSWTGNVRIAAESELAASISRKMNIAEDTNEDQIDDSLRELANMVAGNLKSVLPGICGLATPGSFKLRSVEDLADDFTCLVSLCYRSEGKVLVLTLNSLHMVE
jgi:hypothetical protein